jgi:hypothetical protein
MQPFLWQDSVPHTFWIEQELLGGPGYTISTWSFQWHAWSCEGKFRSFLAMWLKEKNGFLSLKILYHQLFHVAAHKEKPFPMHAEMIFQTCRYNMSRALSFVVVH